jgi:hypothetical protein
MSSCTCDPRHLDAGGFDRNCPVHDTRRDFARDFAALTLLPGALLVALAVALQWLVAP